MSDSIRWLDQFDRIVAAARQHLPEPLCADLAGIAADQRERRAFAGTVLLVGLAGGTGSGKSSLLNALAEEEVSPSGAMRPTTSEALAWIPERAAARLAGLLERFEIDQVAVHDLALPVAIIDLPDVDSVEGRHRRIVAGLLPIIDLVVWVIDPEKYRDRVLHRDHLARLSVHQTRFRFALNQIDRITPEELDLVIADLAQALVADGVQEPVIWAVAADPAVGPPIGIDEVWSGIRNALDSIGDLDQRLTSELRRGMALIEPHLKTLGFAAQWNEARTAAAAAWADDRSTQAVRILREFVVDLSRAATEVDRDLDIDAIIGHPIGNADAIARQLDITLGRHLRDCLRPRATTRALADELALSLPR
ncbi:MAG: hypothetical protein ACRDWH_11230 [Acidimicrobiia bacterium]